jgi:hypothetical protein
VSVTEGGATEKKQPLELARVVYKDGASAQGGTIVFVAPDGTLLTGSPTWTTGTIRDFEVTIKLTRATGVASVSVGFVNQTPLKTYTVNASSFGGIAWTLPGRDGQIIASDEYQVFDVTDDIL